MAVRTGVPAPQKGAALTPAGNTKMLGVLPVSN
jgi:hypothetical protein